MSIPNTDLLIAQLLALRAQVDASLVALGFQIEAAPSENESEICDHPHDQRFDLTVMGGPTAFFCRVCGEEVTLSSKEPPADPSA